MTKEMILVALKALKEGQSIDLVALPDLTPEELAVFEARDSKAELERMLREKGIVPEDETLPPDVPATAAKPRG